MNAQYLLLLSSSLQTNKTKTSKNNNFENYYNTDQCMCIHNSSFTSTFEAKRWRAIHLLISLNEINGQELQLGHKTEKKTKKNKKTTETRECMRQDLF